MDDISERMLRAIFAAALLLCACAETPPLRLDKPARLEPDATIGFFTLGLDATANPDFQPVARTLYVSRMLAGETQISRLAIARPYDGTNLRNDSLVSFQLAPGDYVIEQLAMVEPLWIALHIEVHLSPGETSYLGHFEVHVDQCAGPADRDARRGEPALDRFLLAPGYSVVCALEVQDRFEADRRLVTDRFGVPESMQVVNAAVLAWRRPVVHKNTP
jgi:hypothetical protein